ncbi:MAG: RHS repeat domain-containing protein, partial [Oscillospiraceae bacterium]
MANSNKTTTLVKSVTNAVGTCTYTYDLVGNIKTISDGTYTTSYDYDALNQLVRENNQKENYTKTFEYSNGNITSKKTYVYTLGTLSGTPTVETFAYGDAEWKDLLTSFNGKNITYDAIGNPTKIGTDVLSWQGRQLMSYGTNSYEYNADGQRTSKTVGGVKTEFFYNGSILAGQKCGNDTLIFMYDNNGDSFGFTYNGTEYYYVKNAQNDVIAVANANGTIVAKYTYDAWGKTISITDANGNAAPQNSIGNINPIRYRSYYFDAETNISYIFLAAFTSA